VSGSRRISDAAPGVVVVVKDLFFLARIRETARLAGVPARFARNPDELASALSPAPRLVVVDLTADVDRARIFDVLEQAGERPAVLGFTTHAAARQTAPWHARCDRVVTKETLTRELPTLLEQGVAR
jgi:hypothetical protein